MKGIQTHNITIGDSLQKLARFYNIDDWRLIAEINGLHSPYIDSVFQSEEYLNDNRVAKIGDTILIPTVSTRESAIGNDEIESLAYGIDLDLFDDGITSNYEKGGLTIESGDIKLARGLRNLAQQLMTRLSTEKGSLLLHPDFGSNLHLFTGGLEKQSTRNKIAYEVESCLRSDFRVEDVTNIEIISKNGGTYVSAMIIPIKPGKPFEIYRFLR